MVVVEFAHTNAPGSRHEKRYQDVEELIGNGINVITAINIQHLESTALVMMRVTGIEVRETVPDSFLRAPTSLSTFPVEALRERLREGKIYPPSQIEQALKNFFKPANLGALRERPAGLARDPAAQARRAPSSPSGASRVAAGRRWKSASWCACRRVRAAASSPCEKPAAPPASLNVDWYAVHVDTPVGIHPED